MGKTFVVLLMLGLLTACGGTSLDTKNAATFMRTFQEITADMGEAERLAYAGSILVILEDHEENGESYKRGVEGARQSAEVLFRPESASRFVSRIVLAIGSELNGQSVASINERAAEILAQATARTNARRIEEIQNSIARHQETVTGYQSDLAGHRAKVLAEEARQREAAEFLKAIAVTDHNLAIRENNRGQLSGSFSGEVTMQNGSDQTLARVTLAVTLHYAPADWSNEWAFTFGSPWQTQLEVEPGGDLSGVINNTFWKPYISLSEEPVEFSQNADDYSFSLKLVGARLLDGTEINAMQAPNFFDPSRVIARLEQQIQRSEESIQKLNNELEALQ